MSLNDKIKQAEQTYGMGGSDWFKFREGMNKIRVLAEPAVLATHFANGKSLGVCYGKDNGCPFHMLDQDQPSVRWLTWILDYADGAIKLAGLPWKITREIGAYEASEEYSFGEYPMPFDVTVNAKNAGTMQVEYSIVPARKNTALPQPILDELIKKHAPEQVVEGMKEKARKQNAGQAGEPDAKVDYPEMDEANDAAGLGGD